MRPVLPSIMHESVGRNLKRVLKSRQSVVNERNVEIFLVLRPSIDDVLPPRPHDPVRRRKTTQLVAFLKIGLMRSRKSQLIKPGLDYF